MSSQTGGRLAERTFTYVAVLVIAVFVAVPIYWMIGTALKPASEVFASPPLLVPHRFTLANFRDVLDPSFVRYFGNSLIVACSATAVCLVLGCLSAYGLSRRTLPGRGTILGLLLATQLAPQAVLVIPIFRTASSLHLVNTYDGLVIAYLAFTAPVAVWLVRGFVAGVPVELEEAAKVDGLSDVGAFFRVTLPCAAPGLAATGAYIFFTVWQDFMFALVFMTSNNMRTLPVGILGFIGSHTIQWGQLMAASVLLMIPIVILFGLVQRQFVYGLTQGAVKG